MDTGIKRSIADFLKRNGMDPEAIGIEEGCGAFLRDMENGLAGAPSSLKMIPTYVSAGSKVPTGEPVIAIDAGGTNFRVCVVRFDSAGKPQIEDFHHHPMPGTCGRISREEFFGAIAGYLAPVLDKSDRIGFCFSYPTDMLPNGDGRLIRFCKEVQVDGVEGELIGRGLLDAIAASGHGRGKSVILLNDTVATLLGGKAARAGRQYGSYIGFILGTGTNTCYIERNAAIRKAPALDPAGSMIVNIESGAYDKAPQGAVDREMDAGTVNPGEHLFEKMISGGYFGDMAEAALKKAAAEGLFGRASAAGVAALAGFTARDVNEYLDDPYGAGALARGMGGGAEGERDRTAAYTLLDALYERSARFVAINLSSVVQKCGGGADPCRPVCVTAEGTMFHRSKAFRRKLDYHIKDYLEDRLGLYCEFIEVENATLLGTAIAGLTGTV